LEFPPEPLPRVREKWLLHAALFLATFVCVAGLQLLQLGSWSEALTFAFCLLAILTCHELGHYFVGRLHGVSISPPYFIPIPLGIGTFGAVIRIRSAIPSRNALVDIGAAGPIAGMLVAVPLLFWGTAHSHYVQVPYVAGLHFPGQLSLWNLGAAFVHGFDASAGALGAKLGAGWSALGPVFNPAHASGWSGDCLLSWLAQLLTLGPRPMGTDLYLSPVAEAAWWGLLVTMLNLFPVGQLDGGHVAFALLGEKARKLGQVVHLAMLGLVVVASPSWIVWLLLTRWLVGLGHPPVTRPEEPLSTSRYVISAIALVLLVLTVIPVPFEPRGLM